MSQCQTRRDRFANRPRPKLVKLAAIGVFTTGMSGCLMPTQEMRDSQKGVYPSAVTGNETGSATNPVRVVKGKQPFDELPVMPNFALASAPAQRIPLYLARTPEAAPEFDAARPLVAKPEVTKGTDANLSLARASAANEQEGEAAKTSAAAKAEIAQLPQTQPDPQATEPDALQELTRNPAGDTPLAIPQATPPQAIDLPSALRLADGQNPVIGEARILILEALAQRSAAYALLLPTFNAGANYHDHVGVLQRSNGLILPVTEQSLYVGGGARTLAAESIGVPAVNIFSPLTDAIYEPLAAQQRVRGRQANAGFAANTVLLEVARLYIELIGAQAAFEARKVTATEADRITSAVVAFATSGQGRRSDADRSDVDRRLFQTEILRAEELMAVTSAQLSERLNLDPSSRLQPMATTLVPIELIDPNLPVEQLIQTALAQRPDLERRRAEIQEANYQVRKEKSRPFLPTIWIGFSGGAFGGGSNLVPPTFSRFGGRTDFDVRAYWTLLNFGAGNAALIKQRKALEGQAVAEQSRTINEIRNQVMSARSLGLALRNRVEIAQKRLRSAEDGFAQDQARLRETLAKPIEALDSLRLLSEARIALIEAITRYNQNQFDLFVSLGAPPPL